MIEQVTAAFSKDPSPVKLNLGVGVYRAEVSLSLSLCLFVCVICSYSRELKVLVIQWILYIQSINSLCANGFPIVNLVLGLFMR